MLFKEIVSKEFLNIIPPSTQVPQKIFKQNPIRFCDWLIKLDHSVFQQSVDIETFPGTRPLSSVARLRRS